MIEAAVLALKEALSPPFRSALLKTVGLSILLLIVLGVLLQTLAVRLIDLSNDNYDLAAELLTGVGILVALVFLIPPVTSLIAGFFQDEIAALVETSRYPQDEPGRELPTLRSILLALRFAGLVLAVNLCALLLLFIPGVNLIAWWLANGYLLGREYFEFAAMRFRSEEDAKQLRRDHRGQIFLAGLMIAAFMAIPIVNLATPLVASAFMVHVHKRIARAHAGRELPEARR